jgi:hypothetical protein
MDKTTQEKIDKLICDKQFSRESQIRAYITLSGFYNVVEKEKMMWINPQIYGGVMGDVVFRWYGTLNDRRLTVFATEPVYYIQVWGLHQYEETFDGYVEDRMCFVNLWNWLYD